MFSWCASTVRVSLGRVLAAMEQSRNLKSLSPAELRLLIRNEDPRIRTTTGLANGKNYNFLSKYYVRVCLCVYIFIYMTKPRQVRRHRGCLRMKLVFGFAKTG